MEVTQSGNKCRTQRCHFLS